MSQSNPFTNINGGHALAQAIVDTIREPLLVLDRELRVVAGSRSFYKTFDVTEDEVQGHFVYSLAQGRWDIPGLRDLLERILHEEACMESYEVERTVGDNGPRTMFMNARSVVFEGNAQKLILLAMEDVTAWRAAETAMKKVLHDKEVLLQEMQHRVANSLQIIASILLLKARGVQSEETRLHLRDAHQRVMAVAEVQEQLKGSRHGESIDLGPYITRLCEKLATSMIGNGRRITVDVNAITGEALSSEAVSIGLIITELVINSLKHAFPNDIADNRITVDYKVENTGWVLLVSDNGGGVIGSPKPGLGTSIIEALAKQLDAEVVHRTGPTGTRVEIRHAVSITLLPNAA